MRARAHLPSNTVHLWRAELDSTAAGLDRLKRSLSQEEHVRAARYRFSTDRERFVAARGTLREILARYLNTAPRCLHLRHGTSGKPFLADHRHLRFNLSHSGGTMLVAVAHEREIGVDLERLDAGAAIDEVAESTLSAPERQVLDRVEAESRSAAFLALWTRKEALVKADGSGIFVGLPDIDVSSRSGLVTLWDEATGCWTRAARWLVRTPALDPGHVAAVAAEGRDWHTALLRWPDDLADIGRIAE